MSRSRSNVFPAPGRVIWRFGTTKGSEFYQINGNSYNDYSNNYLGSGYVLSSTFLDNQISFDMPGLYNWKGCDHSKRYGSGGSEVEFSYSPPIPSLFIRPYIWYSPNQPSIPVVNWDPLIEDLATQLQKGSESSFNLLVSLAEARQTFEMMRNPFSVLKSNFRDNPIGKAGAKLKTLTSIWLSGRYGWTPFLSDVSNLSKCLAKNMYTTIPNVEQRFSARKLHETCEKIVYTSQCSESLWDTLAAMRPSSWTNTMGGLPRIRDYSSQTTLVLTCYALDPLLRLNNLCERMLTAAGAVGSWRNIRDVIWEVLPFSFVIDWFIDFSNVWRPLNEQYILQRTSDRVGYSVKVETQCKPEFLFCKPLPSQLTGTLWSGKSPTNMFSVIQEFPPCVSSRYIRSVGLPASASSILKQKGLSLFQCLDGISLILQRAILH